MEKLINYLAWSFYKTTRIEIAELKAEATLAYLEAMNDYDESEGVKATTYVYQRVKNALINFCKKEHKYVTCSYVEDLPGFNSISYNYCPWFELYEILPEKAKKVVKIVLENSDKFDGSGKQMRGQVVDLLRENGMSWSQVWDGMSEVKKVLAIN